MKLKKSPDRFRSVELSGKKETILHSKTDFIPKFWKLQGVKMNKIMFFSGGYLYISTKCIAE